MQDKITKRAVDGLRADAKAKAKTLYLWDAELTGFGALCTKTGSCSYFIEYRLGGRGTPSKRVTLGKHGVFTPEEARKLAKERLGEVANGTDVAQAKKDERHKLTGLTLKDTIERYLKLHEKYSPYWREKRRMLLANFTPLHDRPVTTITKAQISAEIDKVHARSQSVAQLVFTHLRTVLAWACDRSIIDANPMIALRGPATLSARDRVLSDEEIKALWQAVREQSWPFENVFKLLLLTGQRRNEVSGMRWREVDLDAATWTIAKERCKNGKAHALDLSPQAVRLLDPLGDDVAHRLAKTTDDLVFSTTGTTPVSGFSKAKLRVDARMKEILGDKFEPWRIHDLRRTAASGMAALGFQPHVIERVLNHVSGAQGGLVSVYQRHEYREERKRALLAWADRVAAIVNGESAVSNVVRLRA